MGAGKKVFQLPGMARTAALRHEGGGGPSIVRRPVTIRATVIAECAVNALRHITPLLCVTLGANDRFDARWMGKIADVAVAGGAGQVGVNADFVICRVHENAAA